MTGEFWLFELTIILVFLGSLLGFALYELWKRR